MDVPKLSTNGIRMMHDAIGARLKEEDALPAGQPKTYGVRDHADFKKLADEFEAELTKRNIPLTKIVW
jgi:hypothetical protein